MVGQGEDRMGRDFKAGIRQGEEKPKFSKNIGKRRVSL